MRQQFTGMNRAEGAAVDEPADGAALASSH